MASFRFCATEGCKLRLADLKYDRHSICPRCVGHVCDLNLKCSECSTWSEQQFKIYSKHRKKLEVDRARKARNRQKSKDIAIDNVDVLTGRKPDHSISPSFSSSDSRPRPKTPKQISHEDVSQDLIYSPASSLSTYSIKSTPKAAPTPSGDQGIIVPPDEWSNFMAKFSVMDQNLSLLMADRAKTLGTNVHSESVAPSRQDSGPMPAVEVRSGADPQLSGVLCTPVVGGPGSGGESLAVGTCPSDLSPGHVRSLKRNLRVPKDLLSKIKRSKESAGRSSETCPIVVDDQQGMVSMPLNLSLASTSPRRNVEAVEVRALDLVVPVTKESAGTFKVPYDVTSGSRVPQSHSPSRSGPEGRFSASMELALGHICAENAFLPPEQRIQKMKEFCLSADPLNVSYTSSKHSGSSKSVLRHKSPDVVLCPDGSVGDWLRSVTPSAPKSVPAACDLSRPPALSTPKVQDVSALQATVGRMQPKPSFDAQAMLDSVFGNSPPIVSQPNVKPSGNVIVLSPNVVQSDIVPPPGFNIVPTQQSVIVPTSRAAGVPVYSVSVVPASQAVTVPTSQAVTVLTNATTVSHAHVTSFSVVTSVATPSVVSVVNAPHPSVPTLVDLGPSVLSDFNLDGVKSVSFAGPSRNIFSVSQTVHSLHQVPCSQSSVNLLSPSEQSIVVQSPTSQSSLSSDKLVLGSQSSERDEGVNAQVEPLAGPSDECVQAEYVDPMLEPSLGNPLIGPEGEDEPVAEDYSYSATYKKLLDKILAKGPLVAKEGIDLRSPWQVVHGSPPKEKPKSLQMNCAVRSRMVFMDQSVAKKKEALKPNVTFAPFLRLGAANYYKTTDSPDTSVSRSTLNQLAGILDDNRIKFLDQSKVSFTMSEVDGLVKSIFRELEIWSFTTSAFEVMGDGFKLLEQKLPEQDRHIAQEYGSYLKCLDKAGRHGIGEAAHAFSNILLKKREHVLSMTTPEIAAYQKTDLLFSPVSSFKLFVPEVVKDTAKQIRESMQSSALANAAKPQKRFFPYNPSPLQQSRGRGRGRRGNYGPARGGYGPPRGGYGSYGSGTYGSYRRNKDYFKKRDRYIKSARKNQ